MISPGHDTATQRYLNALVLFDEFVRSAASAAPDAAALRGLERRFAERIEIQPSYWSQIKGRSRQIGERLARQFEQRCSKPAGWLDHPHDTAQAMEMAPASASMRTGSSSSTTNSGMPRDEDERFIVELVLTYYRRNPQRARQRLLDLLGEVLTPPPTVSPPPAPPASAVEADAALWAKTRQSIAPLKKKR